MQIRSSLLQFSWLLSTTDYGLVYYPQSQLYLPVKVRLCYNKPTLNLSGLIKRRYLSHACKILCKSEYPWKQLFSVQWLSKLSCCHFRPFHFRPRQPLGSPCNKKRCVERCASALKCFGLKLHTSLLCTAQRHMASANTPGVCGGSTWRFSE